MKSVDRELEILALKEIPKIARNYRAILKSGLGYDRLVGFQGERGKKPKGVSSDPTGSVVVGQESSRIAFEQAENEMHNAVDGLRRALGLLAGVLEGSDRRTGHTPAEYHDPNPYRLPEDERYAAEKELAVRTLTEELGISRAVAKGMVDYAESKETLDFRSQERKKKGAA